jgi:branched-chain amino acid transport system ATP-binding protein
MSAMLRVEGLTRRFGGLVALKDLSFEVQPGEIVGLIGPNGAGKTTAFNLISGTLPPSSGRILFQDKAINGGPPNAVVRLGLARTFQNASVYPKATVLQNIYRGALSRMGSSIVSQMVGTAAHRLQMQKLAEHVDEVIESLGLTLHRDVPAGALSYGYQKRVGVAIGLATNPTMLLLDEPAAGLNPEETAEFGLLLRSLREQRGLTLLLVEHHMALVMGLCDRIVVLVHGQRIAQGTPSEVRSNPAVIEAYLGAPEEFHA